LVARRWTYPSIGCGDRGLDGQVFDLVLRLARENLRWGYVQTVGRRSLGAQVSASSMDGSASGRSTICCAWREARPEMPRGR
jgi:hypothetical protein